MQLVKLSLRNAVRARARALLTIAAVAVSLMTFVLLRSVSAGWSEQVRQTPDDRVVVRHRMGWGRSMPVHYAPEIGELPGVKAVWGVSWAGLVHPVDPRLSFDSAALDALPFVTAQRELEAPPEQRRAFIADRMGAYASRELAEELGWKLGERRRFKTTLLPTDLELTLSGIFHSNRQGFAGRAVYFHWEYFNERLPERARDGYNMIVAQVYEPGQSAKIARAIDLHFEDREDQTFAQEDRATIAQLVARFGAVLHALDFLSVSILGVVLLILGNTVAMGVRERTKEYATLRALGFETRHIMTFILGEAATLGVLGGVLCLAMAYPLIERVLARYLRETANFPPIHVSLSGSVLTLLLGAGLGLCAAAWPAHQVARGNVARSLRKVV
jgi:putative ABC transport system permease protein